MSSAARQRAGEKKLHVTFSFITNSLSSERRVTVDGHAATAIQLFDRRGGIGVHKSELPVGAVIDLKQMGVPFEPCATNPFDYRMQTDGLRLREGSVRILEIVEDADAERIIEESMQ